MVTVVFSISFFLIFTQYFVSAFLSLNRLLLKLETLKLFPSFENINIKGHFNLTKKNVIINIRYIEHYFIDVSENILCNIKIVKRGTKANENAIKGK